MKNQTPLPQAVYLPVPRPGGKVGSPRLLLLLLLGLGLLTAPARAQSPAWAKKTSNTAGKTAVVNDNYEHSYVLTGFTGTTTVGAYTFTSRGKGDVLLINYDAKGQVVWARQIGGLEDDRAGDLDMVPYMSSVFITGSFGGQVKFTNQANVTVAALSSAGLSDVFVARYDLTGDLKWAKRAGGDGDDYAYGIDVSDAEDVYLTGSFTGTMKFTFPFLNLSYSLPSSGATDAFLLKYNANGGFQFGRKLGGTGYDFGTAVAHDKINGDIYVTGGYAPASNPMLSNVLVARYNAAGTLLQQKTYGAGAHLDTGNDIVVDQSGIFVTGYFGGTISFDSMTNTSKGGADAFVVRFPRNASLTATAFSRFGGFHWDEGQSLAYRSGKLYAGGLFRGTASFGATNLSSQGGGSDGDMFLVGLTSSCGLLWARGMGSTSLDYGRGGISLPNDNAICFTGHYGAAITLGSTTLSGNGNLLTRINLPTVTDLSLVNAATDQVINKLTNPATINYLATGTDKINLRANVVAGSVGSVKFKLDGVTKTENAAPYTWAGDALKPDGSTDYLPFTPSLGSHTLEVTPYGGPNGTGAAGVTQVYTLHITSKLELMDLVLINADADEDMFSLPGVITLYYNEMSFNKFNVRAVTAPAKVGSVKFVLDGVTKVENAAPYTLAGDALKPDGSIDYKPITFTPGSHNLKVTAYSGANATGTASNTIEQTIHISTDGSRVAADLSGLKSEFVTLQAAPNPSSGRTMLSFTAAENGPATLEVYNSQGQPVARLFKGTLEKGKAYNWAFDGTQQPAGLYVARLKAGHKVLQQRLVLSK
ncbi:MAG: T9SS type A sorting domain-containing protein [Cytophagales bacterium]|nr:T9SS type A sorting domain-containing protein [Cytophagales bacterium]